jgi:hypothetical protein
MLSVIYRSYLRKIEFKVHKSSYFKPGHVSVLTTNMDPLTLMPSGFQSTLVRASRRERKIYHRYGSNRFFMGRGTREVC